jgi:A/G-specific adenine glycosylase
MKRAEMMRAVRRWYRRNGRSLPWRGSENAYHVLLSEIMLQQTQVGRVLVKFPEFLRCFPTLRRLAAARVADVIVAWRGMGYNNRAVRLHALARILVHRHGGAIPRTQDELLELPGIGRYTAAALLSSVHGLREPVVDVNIRRVYSRILYRMPTFDAMAGEETIWADALELLPARRWYEWNQALMDLGATVCTARNPGCDLCPVRALCASRRTMRKTRSRRTRTEKTHLGLPHRIYRGRIVDQLRMAENARGMSPGALSRRVFPACTASDGELVRMLLAALERDGVVALRRTRNGVRASLA